jgi:hypothetical protein
VGPAGIQDTGKAWLGALKLCQPFHSTAHPGCLATLSPGRSQFRCKSHLIPLRCWGGHPQLEEGVGSSSLVGPSPSLATQSVHVSASETNGCEGNPGEEEQDSEGLRS